MKKFSYLIILILLFCSCSHNKDKDKDLTIEQSYNAAMKLLKDGNYNEAAEKFEKIDEDFPLSRWSIKAQVIAAYAYYKEKKYDQVIKKVDDFIIANPANEDVAYMQYLKGLSYYNLIPHIDRAQDDTKFASYTFRELIARFPLSVYAADAKEKLILVDEHLAGTKMSIGRYQMNNKNYIGAIANFTEVTDRYKNTNQIPEAYYRLVEIYYKLGMNKEAKNFARQLQEDYPQNEWAQKLKMIAIK